MLDLWRIKMKRFDYSMARSFNIITGVVFASQLFLEMTGIVKHKTGFGWIVCACGGAFLLSIIYSIVLVLLNARHNKP